MFSAPFRTVDEGGRFPDTFAESACAVGHARAHAAAFGGDPERVTLVAHSSGAGLAAVVALAADLFPGRLRRRRRRLA